MKDFIYISTLCFMFSLVCCIIIYFITCFINFRWGSIDWDTIKVVLPTCYAFSLVLNLILNFINK
jgi:hypothetical protein